MPTDHDDARPEIAQPDTPDPTLARYLEISRQRPHRHRDRYYEVIFPLPPVNALDNHALDIWEMNDFA